MSNPITGTYPDTYTKAVGTEKPATLYGKSIVLLGALERLHAVVSGLEESLGLGTPPTATGIPYSQFLNGILDRVYDELTYLRDRLVNVNELIGAPDGQRGGTR